MNNNSIDNVIDADVANLPAVLQRNERIVRRSFWRKMRRAMGRIPFADDVLAAYYCATDPRTPARVRAVLLAALAYFVLPTDLIPDIVVGMGFSDDATVIATTIGIVNGYIRRRHRVRARTFFDLPHIHDED